MHASEALACTYVSLESQYPSSYDAAARSNRSTKSQNSYRAALLQQRVFAPKEVDPRIAMYHCSRHVRKQNFGIESAVRHLVMSQRASALLHGFSLDSVLVALAADTGGG